MARMRKSHWWCGLLLGLVGCASGPVPDNPMLVPELAEVAPDSPLWVPERPEAYALVFDRTYSVLDEYFDIAYANRFAGEIQTEPLVTAGYLDLPRLGSYDHYEQTEATLQSVRRRAEVLITPAESGGYYISLKVYKELEDLPRPHRASAGAAVLRYEHPIERQVDPAPPLAPSKGWIPFGRDRALEREILSRLRDCL